MKDILQTIADNKRREIEVLYQNDQRPLYLNPEKLWLKPVFSMSQSIREKNGGIIAEFKRRSPSKGEIAPMADVAKIIPEYVSGGAAACSVLTDTRFFGGSSADLAVAQTLAEETPLLRKDFIISKVQIAEARALGASAILLIASILSKEELAEFHNYAHQYRMETLVEIHGLEELDKLSFSPDMLGVNNRNLSTFHTDLSHSFHLVKSLPHDTVLVAESGIKSARDIKRLRDAGFQGFLIGEAFMSTKEPGKTLQNFIENSY